MPFLFFFLAIYASPTLGDGNLSNRTSYLETLALTSRISLSEVSATVFSESNPIPSSLLGVIKDFSTTADDLKPGVHPRIVFSATEWSAIVGRYAAYRHTPNSWSEHFMDYTRDKGPANSVLNAYANLDTSAYTGEPGMDPGALKDLAEHALKMTEYHEGGIFMYTLHTAVNEAVLNNGGTAFLPTEQNSDVVINVIVNFAKILLAHYATYGCQSCTRVPGMRYSDLWDQSRRWSITNDWYTAGFGMALAYDVLYNEMTLTQRRFVRSALGIAVKGRKHWGITDTSDRNSPNVLLQPHRIFSNWATYHAYLYCTNLAIEGETDFDTMTRNLNAGFDLEIDLKVPILAKAFMEHSIYPDGSNFEDGYMYNLAFREGSMGFLALARRGHNFMDTPRFRNFVYMALQMHEPYRCGKFMGHSSGGGELYPTYLALFRYIYPHGELPRMLWKQRMGYNFRNNNPCRIDWHQIMMQMAILGVEHGTAADSPAGLFAAARAQVSLAVYQPRRGLLVARSSLSEDALYVHFDARPDAFFPGHDNADRGVFTLTALGRTWLDDLRWDHHKTSQDHSLVHIDGQAQAEKAPSVRMLFVKDEGSMVRAAADLTYAYNIQWARPWSSSTSPSLKETVFADGAPTEQTIKYVDKELSHPQDLGWPTDDPAEDIGFSASTKLWGTDDIGFLGLWNWKRQYRSVLLKHAVRTVNLVRSFQDTSYLLIGDDYAMTDSGLHKFQSHLILATDVIVLEDSMCAGSFCMISLQGGPEKFLDVHIAARGQQLSYKTEQMGTSNRNLRLIVESVEMNSEQFCIVLHPHIKDDATLNRVFVELSGDICNVHVDDRIQQFKFDDDSHALLPYVEPSQAPSDTPTPTTSSSPSMSSSSSSSSPSISPTSTLVSSVSSTPSMTESASTSSTPTPTSSMSMSSFPSSTASPSESMSTSSSASEIPSSTPTASSTPIPSSAPILSSTPSQSFTPSPSESSSLPMSPSASASTSSSASASASESSSASSSSSPTLSVTASVTSSNILAPSVAVSASSSVSATMSSLPSASTTSTAAPSVSSTPKLSMSTSPSTSRTPATSQSSIPQASKSTEPMNPVVLRYNRIRKLTRRDMGTDASTFYDPYRVGPQIVFRYYAKYARLRFISTCFRFTKVRSVILVYDCGRWYRYALRRYKKRQCQRIVRQRDNQFCTRITSWVTFFSRRSRYYFIVVTVQRMRMNPWKLAIRAK